MEKKNDSTFSLTMISPAADKIVDTLPTFTVLSVTPSLPRTSYSVSKHLEPLGFKINDMNYQTIYMEDKIMNLSDDELLKILVSHTRFYDLFAALITRSYIYDDPSTLQNGCRLHNIFIKAHGITLAIDNNFAPMYTFFDKHQPMLRFMLRVSFSNAEEFKVISNCLNYLSSNYCVGNNELHAIGCAFDHFDLVTKVKSYKVSQHLSWMRFDSLLRHGLGDEQARNIINGWDLCHQEDRLAFIAVVSHLDPGTCHIPPVLGEQFFDLINDNDFEVARILCKFNAVPVNQIDAFCNDFVHYINMYLKYQCDKSMSKAKLCIDMLNKNGCLTILCRRLVLKTTTIKSINDISEDAMFVLDWIIDNINFTSIDICCILNAFSTAADAVQYFTERYCLQVDLNFVVSQFKEVLYDSESRNNKSICPYTYNCIARCKVVDDSKIEAYRAKYYGGINSTISILEKYIAMHLSCRA